METKKFQTETKKLLDLMINSIYTHKEIFLRELISNASDAIDKRHYLSLTDERYNIDTDNEIYIEVNKEDRTIKISDTGLGMTHDDLIQNLGTIAKSGSKEFLEKLEDKATSDIDIIGQFGVGFYSAFMVSKKIEVKTKSPLDKAYLFKSDGNEKYTIEETDKDNIGTEITLFLKDNTDEEKYDKYLEFYEISSLVKKYSDYVRYPIKMYKISQEPIKDEDGKDTDDYNEIKTLETLNSMQPIWKKNKSEVKDEELNEFYKNKFSDYEDPIITVFTNVEGNLTYNALCYIPSHAPYNLYSDSYERGLQLYTRGVFILDKCKELIPNYLRFVKGLVDSSDLQLNISREMLQHNRQLEKIASNLEKKILNELAKTLKNDRERYEKFFNVFGVNLKYGVYEDFGMKKEDLKDLILFKSANTDKLITLKEYIEAMPEEQEFIYYGSGRTREAIMNMPQMDFLKQKNYDVLLLTDDIDEFMITVLDSYNEKKFQSIQSSNLDLLNEDEKKQIEDLKVEKKDLLEALREALKDQVKDVVLSKKLASSPVCLSSGEGLSFEMERVMNEMPSANHQFKADRILEINPHHEIFKALSTVYEKDKDGIKDYAKLLYNQALLIEGMKLDDPLEFSNLMCKLMIEATK